MTQKITQTVVKSFLNVSTNEKNEKGYFKKETIGTIVAAGSMLGGFEVKSDFAQIDLRKVAKLQQEGKIKDQFLQFQINPNYHYEKQIADLKAKIAELTATPTESTKTGFEMQTQPDNIPF